MSDKILVIGMGQFGASFAMEMARRGADVTVLDPREERIALVSNHVGRALVGDGADERILSTIDMDKMDIAVNAIGEEALESSILCTALLKQLGAQRIVARAVSDVHRRILLALGVNDLVNPESEIAISLARRLSHPGVIRELELGDAAELTELDVPETWVGQSLVDLALRRRLGVSVVAVKRPENAGKRKLVPSPDPARPLARGERMLIIGRTEDMEKLFKEIS